MDNANLGEVVAVAIHATGSTFEFSAPRPLFDSGYLSNARTGEIENWNTFDVSADGQRFLIARRDDPTNVTVANTPITVVLNWTAALRKK